MITSQRTMPESDFRSEYSLDRSTDELLNPSELQTVLDMLAVMETVEELSQLQALTEAQKRQVWEATPESLKQTLWRLRNQPTVSQRDDALETESDESGQNAEQDLNEQDSGSEQDEEIEDLGQDLDLSKDVYLSIQTSQTHLIETSSLKAEVSELETTTDAMASFDADRLIPTVNDWVILKAQPKLTAPELRAIWSLIQIEGNDGTVSHSTLGTRSYPLTWMVVYSRPSKQETANLTDLNRDSDSTDLGSTGLTYEEPF